ncbi:hypothetical protein KIN20_010289 [Parelaphostrongylus tenuis]|uniref:Uncharacterized protein n=1 Tax=Parelaphostrongylus tenuis TaxID=148309 RepID=A0AAD5MT73_PARTN|nr:hypothetical protein KIN20_010289 [Parelaphostrongylus tenuis]
MTTVDRTRVALYLLPKRKSRDREEYPKCQTHTRKIFDSTIGILHEEFEKEKNSPLPAGDQDLKRRSTRHDYQAIYNTIN